MVQFTLFAHVMGVADESTLRWLVKYTLKNTDWIKTLIKSRITMTTQNCDIAIHELIAEDKRFDEENDSTL